MKKVIPMVLIGGMLFAACQPATQVITTASPSPTPSATATPAPSASPSAAMTKEKAFTVTGNNFSFDVKEIKVKKGETVKITFKNSEGFHDWRVDEFNAFTKTIAADKEDVITFVADKSGTFEYYCSVGQHRAMGMVGKLIVE